jgi:segregation and condensation protein B
MTDEDRLKQIVEAALLAAGRPLSLDQLQALFPEAEAPEKKQLREVLTGLSDDYQGRGIEITEVGSGFRIQVRAEFSPWVSKLWAERPPKYSRALLETLALIAYRQPITRGEIEDVRGVSVSTNIIKTLTEREWVRVVGHRDVPGKPALYATTKEFLDYFNLKSLNELPTLAEIRDLESINRELELVDPETQAAQGGSQADQVSDESPTATDLDEPTIGIDSGEGEDTIPLMEEESSELSLEDPLPDESHPDESLPVETPPDESLPDESPPDEPLSDEPLSDESLSEEPIEEADSEDEPLSKPAAHESE